MYSCTICKCKLSESDTYEYRGAYSCEIHFDEVCSLRERERQNIIEEESAKTRKLAGLDLGDSVIGRANRKLLKSTIHQASQESLALRRYEGRE